MPRAKRDRRNDDEQSLDLTPMIDVTFLLIIFFLVVTQITSQDHVDLCLPDALTVPEYSETEHDFFTVHIAPVDQSGHGDQPREYGWFCNGEPRPKHINEMRAILDFEAARVDPSRDRFGREDTTGISENTVLVRCDARAPSREFGRLIQLLSELKVYKVHVAVLKDPRID